MSCFYPIKLGTFKIGMLSRIELLPKGKPKGRRVAAYVPEEIAVELEKWADNDTRSLSGLITHLLVKAVEDRQNKPKDSAGDER
jgi:hypothetical protein